MTDPGAAITNVPLRGAAVLESPSGMAMELRWLTYESLADAELIERAGSTGAALVDPGLAGVAASALQQVSADLASQGVRFRFSTEERPNRPDEIGRAAAEAAKLDNTVELAQYRVRLDPDASQSDPPDSLVVRPVADGEPWEPIGRIHEAALGGSFLRSTDTTEGLRVRLAESNVRPYTVYVVEDPEVSGQFVGMVATALYRSSPASPPVGEISLLGVDPDWRRRGLGRSLVEHAMAALAAAGARTAMAYVESTNEPATALFEAIGFNRRATRTYFSS